jgi:hypothetical protein
MHDVGQQALVVLVSASSKGDELRRDLATRGLAVAGATGGLSHLRRSLVRERMAGPVILCVTLDDATFRRHGNTLARMLDDRASFATPLHAIGLAGATVSASAWASIGCDAWARNLDEVVSLVERLAGEHIPASPRATAPGGRLGRAAADLNGPDLHESDLNDSALNIDPLRAETREMDLR